MTSSELIKDNLTFCTEYQLGIVSYCIEAKNIGDSWNKIVIAFNGKRESAIVPLPEGKYQLVISGDKFEDENTDEIFEKEISVEPISMMLLAKI
jgi:pullulanase